MTKYNPLKIDVPDGLEDVAKFGDVVKTINRYRIDNTNTVYLNLKRVSSISPYGLIGLLLLGKMVFERTLNKSHIIDLKMKHIKHLERMDFYEKGASWFHEPRLKKKLIRSKQPISLLEIQEINRVGEQGLKDVTSIAEKFYKRGAVILGPFKKKMDVYKFLKVITELCSNVHTHSQSNGYFAIQRYKNINNGGKIVKLSVSDDGIGIKSSLISRHPDLKNENEAKIIAKALEPNVSGTLENRGFGLSEVRSIVEAAGGYLWISSGEGAILQEPDGDKINEYVNLPYVTGTRIAVMLSLEKLVFSIDKQEQISLYSSIEGI